MLRRSSHIRVGGMPYHGMGCLTVRYVSTGTCTGYYNYFLYDTAAQDTLRVENPDITTFGYCSEEWIAAVLFLGGLVMMATVRLHGTKDLLGRFHTPGYGINAGWV